MRKICILLICFVLCITSVYALDYTAPDVPGAGSKLIPQDAKTFQEGLLQIIGKLLPLLRPDLLEAIRISTALIAIVLMISLLQSTSASIKNTSELIGAITVFILLATGTNSLTHLGSETIQELSEYEKLLLPVLTASIAAQGGVSTATALYTGTAIFNTLICDLLCNLFLPLTRVFFLLSVTCSAFTSDQSLEKIKDILNKTATWLLKTIVTGFTAFLGLSGVVSGTADAAALKITKSAISTVIPVIGSIISNASEAVLVSASLAKNAIGVYGIYAILAIFLEPFARIGMHYIVLKTTAAVCCVFGTKRIVTLIDDISTVMRLILAATGAMCFVLLVSCICFLKGVGT